MSEIYAYTKKIFLILFIVVLFSAISYGVAFLKFGIKESNINNENVLLKKEIAQLYNRINIIEDETIALIEKNKKLKSNNKDLEYLLNSASSKKKNDDNYTSQNKGEYADSKTSAIDNLRDNFTSNNGLPSKEMFKTLIATTNPVELAGILSSITRIPVDELLEKKDLKGLANKYAEIAFSGYSSNSDVGIVEFATKVNSNNTPKETKSEFSSKTGKIYATFNLPQYDNNKILVKWIQSDTNAILLLSRYNIKALSNNYVWLKQNKWLSGNYRVEIYSTGNEPSLLAIGEYFVFEDES